MSEQEMAQLSSTHAERLRHEFQRCRDMEGTLGERLQSYAAAGRDFFPAYSEAVDRLVARVRENGGGEDAPRPGETMPPFMLPDETGRLLSLQSLISQGPAVLMFYRGHWCPYCRLNVSAVIQAQRQIEALGGQIVAIMPETQKYAERFKSEAGVPFPVLTDLDNGYALSLNLAIWLGAEIQQLLCAVDPRRHRGERYGASPVLRLKCVSGYLEWTRCEGRPLRRCRLRAVRSGRAPRKLRGCDRPRHHARAAIGPVDRNVRSSFVTATAPSADRRIRYCCGLPADGAS